MAPSQIAFLFPGQGSQYPGMGKNLLTKYPLARQVFDEADAALGMSLSRLILEGPEAELKKTVITQPAILATSVAYFRVLESLGFSPHIAAGHSLGEYSALVANGALSLSEACRLVSRRGEWMQNAVPQGEGGMAALTGVEETTLNNVLNCLRSENPGQIIEISARNCPGQIVLSGSALLIEKLLTVIKEKGFGRGTLLAVSAPFHCTLLKAVEDKMRAELTKISFKDFRFPYVANATADLVVSKNDTAALLVRQICAPVAWQESMNYLWQRGVRRFIEIGPGRVLSGLARRCFKGEGFADSTLFIGASDDEGGLSPDSLEHLV